MYKQKINFILYVFLEVLQTLGMLGYVHPKWYYQLVKNSRIYMQANNQLHPPYFSGDIAKVCKLDCIFKTKRLIKELILLNGVLISKLLNKPFASCYFTNLGFLFLQLLHFHCISNLLFFVLNIFGSIFSVPFLHFKQ